MDTQDLNLRSQKEKSYHLIVSFRPEDNDKLTPEIFKEIEQIFAAALGFGEHQRHCGVHQNTGNLHLHIAYNMIHPERLTRHEPFRDFHTRDRVCRELEQRFGLAMGNGRGQSQTPEAERLGDKPATMEAHSGLESFESYAKSKREAILDGLQDATSWRDVHVTLACSRHQYVEFVLDQKVETWLGCHRRAFEFFGGVPGKCIIDNPKCAITKACMYDPEVQRAYAEFAEGYGFLISPCPVPAA